jgi:transposase/ATP:corrinoid adenosyltransferase
MLFQPDRPQGGPAIELPRLSSAELERLFEGDARAQTRYRMLSALLHEGRAPGEVARTFGVSRETLRRLRGALAEQGLDALRQRTGGGGHRARHSPLIQVLEEVLREQSGAGTAQLVRLVRARLQTEGQAAPRSTIYRLLRAYAEAPAGPLSPDESSDDAHDLLRAALLLLPEEPPIALGQSRLAARLVPFESDPLRRGLRLQEALRRAIELLRPDDTTGPRLDAAWRAYLIVAGEYITGEDRISLQDSLALSASTYSRAKRAALTRILATLPLILSAAPPPDPPPMLIAPPAPPAAFDRLNELELYQRLLQRRGLVLIWGPAGRGKSGLAAALAAQLRTRGQVVVWHNARGGAADEAGPRLLTTLAAALALHQARELWHTLAAAVALPGNAEAALATLARDLGGRRWTVIVDGGADMADELALRLLDVLAAAARRGDLRLVLTGREAPAWLEQQGWPAAPPLDDEAARASFTTALAALLPAPSSSARRPPHSAGADLTLLREQVQALLAALQSPDGSLPPEQRADLLAALAPVEQLIAALREEREETR